MKRSVAILTVILFFVWIIPLGAFIKSSQERLTCGGKRAVCMCSSMKYEVKSAPVAGPGLKSNSNDGSQTNGSAGGAGQNFVIAHSSLRNVVKVSTLQDPLLFRYRNPFRGSIDHVPWA